MRLDTFSRLAAHRAAKALASLVCFESVAIVVEVRIAFEWVLHQKCRIASLPLYGAVKID